MAAERTVTMLACPALAPLVQGVSFFAVHAASDLHIHLHMGCHIYVIL